MKNFVNKLILIALLLGLLVLIGSSCSPKVTCPTYDGAYRAKKQMSFERKGGHTATCAYRPDVTKKEKKRASKIWHSNFCNVKPKKSTF